MKNEQSNFYQVIDSMGRQTDRYIVESNITAAYKEAKAQGINKEYGAYWKLKRCYNGGVRG